MPSRVSDVHFTVDVMVIMKRPCHASFKPSQPSPANPHVHLASILVQGSQSHYHSMLISLPSPLGCLCDSVAPSSTHSRDIMADLVYVY